MVTWVLYLCIGIVIGGMAGFYFAKLDDFSKKQKRELEEKLQRSEQELIDYKDQVTTHFKETATLINSMTESYQKVHEHLARGSVELCNNAIEVNKLEVSPDQLLTDSVEKTAADVAHTQPAEQQADEADKVLTEKAESEAPKEDVTTEETITTKESKEEVDVAVSAAGAAVDDVEEEVPAKAASATETVAEKAPETPSPQTVAASPDSSTPDAKSAKNVPSSGPSADLPPPVTETMAVAEELEETASDSEKARIPGSRMVH